MMAEVYNYPDHEICKHQNKRLREQIADLERKLEHITTLMNDDLKAKNELALKLSQAETALREIEIESSNWMAGQNSMIRSGLLIVYKIAQDALGRGHDF